MSAALTSFSVLLLVVLSIPLVLWLVKRLSQLPAGRANGLMSIAATLSVGPNEQIAVVKVGERAMLVGITSQSIQLLTELDARDLPAPSDLPQAASQGFGSLLAGLQKKNTP